jgi:Methyltransferase domain
MPGISTFDTILQEVLRLPDDWHEAGSFPAEVLEALVTHSSARPLTHTAETGTGKSTLLLSHLSEDHTVFTSDDSSNTSLGRVMESPLLNRERVHFVLGPTQSTLTRHTFLHPLQLVLLDGPHGYPFPEMEYWSFYPHLEENGLLIVDDIHIPTIGRLFEFLREEQMFDDLGAVHTTAFFRRNATELFDPFGDGWWRQNFNRKRFSWPQELPASRAGRIIRRLVPASLRRQVPKPIRRVVRRIVER